jgi:hypothetical protein
MEVTVFSEVFNLFLILATHIIFPYSALCHILWATFYLAASPGTVIFCQIGNVYQSESDNLKKEKIFYNWA